VRVSSLREMQTLFAWPGIRKRTKGMEIGAGANVPGWGDAGRDSQLLSPRACPVASLVGGILPQLHVDSVP